MSNTQGASDLDNDMPGIGAAPGAARGAPSALQSLAQFFKQSQGPQNPKFLPPPPGPGGQDRGRVQLGPSEPPDPTVRSIGPRPANAPQPPPKFNPFIRSMPRDTTEWGQPEAFPRLPQTFELPGMYQSLGNYFAQNGSFASRPMGAGLAAYSKAYQDAYVKGMDQKMKMAREQMVLHREQLAELEERKAIEYADIYNKHIEMGDPAGSVDLHDEIWRKAVELGDNNVIQMMEGGASVEKVRRFLMDHEARLRDLQKANTKASEQDAADELYGLKPRAATTDPWDQGPATPGEAAARAAAPSGEVAGPGAPSGDKRAPGVGDPLDKPDKGEDADNIPDDGQRRMHDAAIDVLKGYEPKNVPPDVLRVAGAQAKDMRDKLGRIFDDAKQGKIRPDQVIPEVRKQVGGNVADDLQSVLDYRMPGVGGGGQGGGTGGKEGEYLRLLGNGASIIDQGDPQKGIGGWNAANYQAQERFRTDVNTQTVILRSNSLAADGNAVLADLKELERQGRPATGLDLSQLTGSLLADPSYAKLRGDWLAYNDAFNTVVTGGRHVESGTMAQVNVAPTSYASPAAFRNAMKGHMNDALGYLEGEHVRWESIGGKPTNMPSYNPKTEKELRDIRDMDYLTGTLPGQTFTNHKGVTKRWKGGSLNPYDTSNWE